MSHLNQLTLHLLGHVTVTAETVQLAVLQRIIATSRLVRRAQLWVRPIQRWLWLMPASYLVGLIGGYLLFAR